MVTILSALCAALLSMSSHAMREQNAGADDLRALYMAEAGLAEAYNALAQGKDGNVGTSEQPARFGPGVYWVEAEGQGDGVVALRSTACVGAGRRTLELGVVIHVVSSGNLGVFGDEQVHLGSGAMVDAYDSALGSYASQAGGSVAAKVASNGSISLGSGAIVRGDCVPGSGFTVDLGVGASVSGSSAPSTLESAPPGILVPDVGDIGGDLVVSTVEAFGGGSLHLDAVQVAAGGTLTLAGPLDAVFSSLNLAPGASLVFDTTNGPIQLVVAGDLVLAASSTVSDSGGSPSELSIYLLGDNGDVASSSSGTTGASVALGGVGLLGTAAQRPGDPPATTPDQGSPPESARGAAWTEAWDDLGWASDDGEPDVSIVLAASGELHALLYAPSAALEIPASLRFLGAVAARRLTVGDGAHVSLDRRLLVGAEGNDLELEIVAWSIQEVPLDVPFVQSRRDPIAMLTALGIIPLDTALAHTQKAFSIRYRDLDGATRSFFGVEELFDWSEVDTVTSVFREGEATTEAAPRTRGDAGRGTLTKSGQSSWYAASAP
jgi:hypothetical protein